MTKAKTSKAAASKRVSKPKTAPVPPVKESLTKSASSLGSDARRGLEDHPTVKPAAMLADALLDLTNRGEITIDPFLGSGSTLIAAERTGRSCRGVELDPLYIDVILRRYQAETGQSATLEATGETFGLSLS
jgi:DNA modification methylase